MTGDDAVVRVDHARAAIEAETLTFGDDVSRKLAVNVSVATLDNLARAYLVKAAEIERLTDNGRGLKCLLEAEGTALMQWKARAEASEARTADLLAETQALKDAASAAIDECVELDKRTADLLKALEEYGKHHGICPHSADPFTSQACRCGLVETLAAAKGETV